MRGIAPAMLLAMIVAAGGPAFGSGGGGGGGDDNFVSKAFKSDQPAKPPKPKPKKATTKKPAAPTTTGSVATTPVAATASANGGIADCERDFTRTLLSGCISDHLNKLATRLDSRKEGPLADAVATLRTTAAGLREAPSKEHALTVMEKAKTTLDAAVNTLQSGPQASKETADSLSAISGTLGHAIGAIQRKG
jgi:hypothetical protein